MEIAYTTTQVVGLEGLTRKTELFMKSMMK